MQKHCLFCPRFQEEADEGIRDLIQMTKKKLDLDKDDVVSFEDFSGTVKKDPTMTLEVFGPCIPPEGVIKKDICIYCNDVPADQYIESLSNNQENISFSYTML